MKRIITTVAAAAMLVTLAIPAQAAQVWRSSLEVTPGQLYVSGLCVLGADIGLQCFTTDKESKGRVAADQIDNSISIYDAGEAVAWAETRFGMEFNARMKGGIKRQVFDGNGLPVLDGNGDPTYQTSPTHW